MTNKALKKKVTEKLINHGNNKKDVEIMVIRHFNYAIKHYSTVKTICECIRTIY